MLIPVIRVICSGQAGHLFTRGVLMMSPGKHQVIIDKESRSMFESFWVSQRLA